MGKKISVRDGQYVFEAYKEYLLNSMISMGIWRSGFSRLWEEAAVADGYNTATLKVIDGREYFGGTIFVNGVSTPETLKLLESCGYSEDAIQDFRDTQANGDVNAIELMFKPQQTYTLDGLSWFLAQEVKPRLESEGATSLSLSKTIGGYASAQDPMPVASFKTSVASMVADGGNLESMMNLAPTSHADTNEVMELLYRSTSLLDDNAVVSTVVTEHEGVDDYDGSAVWSYTTTTTITFNDFSFLADVNNLQALYDLIYFENDGTIYPDIYMEYDDSYGSVYVNYSVAGYLWHLENGYTGERNTFDDADGLVVYADGYYWIDKEKFRTSNPELCVITLGKLLHVYVHIDGGGFFNTFIGNIFKGFISVVGLLVEILGEITFAIFWVMGGFMIDIVFTNKDSVKKFKKAAKQIMGTVALMLITLGASEALQVGAAAAPAAAGGTYGAITTSSAATGTAVVGTAIPSYTAAAAAASMSMSEIFIYGTQALSMGVEAYTTLTAKTVEAAATDEIVEVEDMRDPIAIVYEDEDEPDMIDLFFDSVYELIDPTLEIEV